MVGLLAPLIASIALAQDPGTLSERIDVHLINVDVVVTDRRGNPVSGLTAQDFEVLEDGAPREISNFAEIRTDEESTNEPTSAPSTAAIVLVDNATVGRSVRQSLARSLPAAVDALTRDGIPVMFAVLTGNLEYYTPLTTDRLILKDAIQRITTDQRLIVHQTNTEAHRRNLAKTDPCFYEMVERARYGAVVAAISTLIARVSGNHSKKALLLVTTGFSMRLAEDECALEGLGRAAAEAAQPTRGEAPGSSGGLAGPFPTGPPEINLSSDRRWLAGATRAQAVSRWANRDGVTLYTLYGGGLQSSQTSRTEIRGRSTHPRNIMPSEVSDSLASMNLMAWSTGGISTGTTNVTNAVLSQLHQDLGAYYSLGYRTRADDKRPLRKIELRLKKRERYDLRYRREIVLDYPRPAP
jgi:VWFA-related protein